MRGVLNARKLIKPFVNFHNWVGRQTENLTLALKKENSFYLKCLNDWRTFFCLWPQRILSLSLGFISLSWIKIECTTTWRYFIDTTSILLRFARKPNMTTFCNIFQRYYEWDTRGKIQSFLHSSAKPAFHITHFTAVRNMFVPSVYKFAVGKDPTTSYPFKVETVGPLIIGLPKL